MSESWQELVAGFHFLRPGWLLLIPFVLWLVWFVRRRHRAAGWQGVIATSAIRELAIGNAGGGKLAVLWVLLPLLLACVALAGPSWQLLPEKIASNRQALVYVLDLSPSMLARDVSPDRLTQARLKLSDLLDQRSDGDSALIVYAGDAHRIAPLTDDPATIKALLPTLHPDIMPLPGSQTEAAIELAVTLLSGAAHAQGDIILVTDGVHADAIAAIKEQLPRSYRLSILGLGSTSTGATIPDGDIGVMVDTKGEALLARLNSNELQQLAAYFDGHFAELTPDNEDIAHLLAVASRPIKSELLQSSLQYDQWHDAGYWLALLLLPFAALVFRRQCLWVCLPAAVHLAMALSLGTVVMPTATLAADWSGLWLSDDQQAMRLLESGDNLAAAERFNDPRWKAVALYRAGDYAKVLEVLGKPSTAEDFYLLANSHALLQQFDQAITAYKSALALSAGKVSQFNLDARYNIALLQGQLDAGREELDSPENKPESGDDSGEQNEAGDQSAGETDNATSAQRAGGALGEGDTLDQAAVQDQGESGDALRDTGDSVVATDATVAESGPRADDSGEANDDQPDDPGTLFEKNNNTVLNPYAEQWLRTLPQDPGGYLRRKLSYQTQINQQQQADTDASIQSPRY